MRKIQFIWQGFEILPEDVDWVDPSYEGFIYYEEFPEKGGITINWGSMHSYHLTVEKITHTLFVTPYEVYFSNNVPPNQMFEISLRQEDGTEIGSCESRNFKLRDFSRCVVGLPAGMLLLQAIED